MPPSRRLRATLALLAGLCGLAHSARASETVPLYLEYADAPFSIDTPHSLTLKLADWLSAHSAARYRFVPTFLPRRRLAGMLAEPRWKGVVAWANPEWFKDEGRQRYLWSIPYIADANVVVSRRARPVDYSSPESLRHLRFGGILGFRYASLEALFASNGIEREDVNKEMLNLMKLKAGRIDVTIVQASALPYLRRGVPDFDEWAYVARTPHSRYQRYLFVAPDNQILLDYLNQALAELKQDKSWREVGLPE